MEDELHVGVSGSRLARKKDEDDRLPEFRARVKATWAVVAATSGLAETLARDWRKAARFYARFRVTEGASQHGVAEQEDGMVQGHIDEVRIP